MAKDGRDIVEVLQQELDFIQKGGYGRSVRTPWLPKSIFQDSLTCLNYGCADRAHPCSECWLLEFVPPEDRSEMVPCHFIPLSNTGESIEDLESVEDQARTEKLVRDWLCLQLSRLQTERSNSFCQNVS